MAIDRLAMRARPAGTPVMEQNWENTLFLHWPVNEGLLRPLIPPQLEIDTFNGQAWIGITPFRVSGLRVASLPPIPGLDGFNELNVRTYVHYHGIPGIWFLSLDASKLVPAITARLFYQLPYFSAAIEFARVAGEFLFDCERTLSPPARFRARWRRGARLRDPDTESLAFFLVERYCFFTQVAGGVNLTRAYLHPWILEEAVLAACESTLLSGLGLPEPASEPLVYFSAGVNVQIWPPVPA